MITMMMMLLRVLTVVVLTCMTCNSQGGKGKTRWRNPSRWGFAAFISPTNLEGTKNSYRGLRELPLLQTRSLHHLHHYRSSAASALNPLDFRPQQPPAAVTHGIPLLKAQPNPLTPDVTSESGQSPGPAATFCSALGAFDVRAAHCTEQSMTPSPASACSLVPVHPQTGKEAMRPGYKQPGCDLFTQQQGRSQQKVIDANEYYFNVFCPV